MQPNFVELQKYPLPELKEPYKIYDYQEEAQRWMESREIDEDVFSPTNPNYKHGITGGIIVMEMGLGKSLLSLYHIFSMQQKKNESFPTIIISSKTVMYEWKMQSEKFYPSARVCFFHREIMGKQIDTITAAELRTCSIVFTTYDVLLSYCRRLKMESTVCVIGADFTLQKGKVIGIENRERPKYDPNMIGGEALYNMPWTRVIADESQRFANHNTKTYIAVMAVYARWRFCLSGSPVKNYNTDIWSQLRFCGFSTINVPRKWDNVRSYTTYNLSRFVYVKNYEDVQVVIPPKKDHVYEVVMVENQRNLYGAYLRKMKGMFAQLADKTVNMMAILAIFTRLRQTCIAPYIVVRPKKKGTETNDELLKEAYGINTPAGAWIRNKEGDSGYLSPKVVKIVEVIKNIPPGEKTIVFSMFTSCLQTIEEAVQNAIPEIKTEYIDGKITGDQRFQALERYRYDPSISVLYVHYKVGGEGLNITAANNTVFIEPWWNHVVHNQALARMWRRGQEKEVNVHWIITKGTIEEEILKMCDNKHGMANEYIHGQTYTKKTVSLNKYDLERMIDLAIEAHDAETARMAARLNAGYEKLWSPPPKGGRPPIL